MCSSDLKKTICYEVLFNSFWFECKLIRHFFHVVYANRAKVPFSCESSRNCFGQGRIQSASSQNSLGWRAKESSTSPALMRAFCFQKAFLLHFRCGAAKIDSCVVGDVSDCPMRCLSHPVFDSAQNPVSFALHFVPERRDARPQTDQR